MQSLVTQKNKGRKTRSLRMSADIYAALHDALHTASDWKATSLEIDLIRTAIQHRDKLDALSDDDRKTILIIAKEYKSRAQKPSYHRKQTTPPEPARQDIDVSELSFVLDPIRLPPPT